MNQKISTFLIFLFLLSLNLYSQKADTTKTEDLNTIVKKEKKKSKIKKYEEIIDENTISDEGLFTIHQNDEQYIYEIPFSLLDVDMLLVSRISKVAPGFGGGFTSSGSKTNEQVIHWTRKHNKILLKSISFNNVANDSLPIYTSVVNNNYHPVIASFDILAYNPDSNALLIDINSLFLNDVRAISPMGEFNRKNYKFITANASNNVRFSVCFFQDCRDSNNGSIPFFMSQIVINLF